MIHLLQMAYKDVGHFMFYKVRHVDKQIFRSAIRKQNAYLAKSRVIPIQGISEEVMFSLENDLIQIDGITEGLRHKATTTTGRWSILTTESQFKPIIEILKHNLVEAVKNYSTTTNTKKNVSQPRLRVQRTTI